MATVSSGQTVTAAQYNDLQSRTNQILGTGSGDSGYGQSLTSAQVLTGSTITATQMDNLRVDINKCHNHQQGTDAGIGNIDAGQIIGADASGTSLGALTETTEGYNDYDSAVTTITTNRFLINEVPANSTTGSLDSSARTSSWSTSINHEFTCSFTDANHARHFFNSGGEIRFSSTHTGGSGSKTTSWQSIQSTMGTIKFKYTSTAQTGTGGTTTSKGWYDLTTSYQEVFRQNATGATYGENYYKISAKRNSPSTIITFNVEYIDADTGDPPITPVPYGGTPGGVDESVNGTITSVITGLRASGSNVSVNFPSVSTTSELQ
tara:strand:+ start:5431 stop:6393 length:963 start_codon:yes stop_codon:yes gene_type:complete